MAKIFNKELLKEYNLFGMTSIIFITSIITLFIVKYVFIWGYVPTESMHPTIEKGDKLLDESSYAENTNDCTSMSKIIVSDDCVFVMGDNRENSYDSRYWENKFVSLEDIEGVICFKISGLKVYSLV